MYIIVGLGNPETKYDNTYHNIGFMIVDNFAKKFDVRFNKKECKAKTCSVVVDGKKVILAKPETYMNLSGLAAQGLKSKYKDAKLIVVCDDIDLQPGKIRYRESGSGGTHNGLRNIVSLIGEDFARLKIGIGRDENMDLADYVLSKIKDKELYKQIVDEATKILIGKINA